MRAALLGALLLCAACDGAEEKPPPANASASKSERWGRARVGDFSVWLPETWGKDSRVLAGDGWQFFGPAEDGFKPSQILYWRPWRGDEKGWYRHWESKFGAGNPLVEVRDRGSASVAGMSARYLVYRQTEGERGFLTIDWYFSADGRGGILRCVATDVSFVWKYRALFEEMARGLRYEPAR